MTNRPPPPDHSRQGRQPARFWLYVVRGIRLRCPQCGVSPVYVRLGLVRNLRDWARPLDGCPLCQYRYEREPGYFLGASWIHYGVVAGTSLVSGLIADGFFHARLGVVLAAAIVPTLIICVPFVRWSKTLFLAFDRYVDRPR